MSTSSTPLPGFRDRAELLDFLLEVAEAGSLTLDLDSLMANLAEIVRKVVPWDLFAILMYSERRQGLTIRYSIGHRPEMTERLLIPLSEGLTGAAATTLEPVLVGDVRSDPRYIASLDAVRSELAVPMVARKRLVGVIDLQSTRLNAYSEEQSTLLRLIASRVGASIDNARLHRRVLRQNNTLRTLAQLAHSFSSTLDLDELLNKIAVTVRRLINYDAFSILLLDAQGGVLRRRFNLRYDQEVDLENVPLGRGITGAAVEQRTTVLVKDTRSDPRYIESTTGIRSEVAVPLAVPERLLGVMDLESSKVAYFNEEHVRTLELLAPLIAKSVQNASLYEQLAERERRLADNLGAARDLQAMLLLRQPPEIDGLDVAARHRPAAEISGDLYDFFRQHDAHVIAFGDVSGKGAAAALYGTLVAGLLRTLAPRGASPGTLMRSLNAALGERKVPATYVTLLILFWQRELELLTISNAGMFPPIICRQGQILKQRAEGIPIGLLDNRIYDEIIFRTAPGDAVLLYSDGIHDQVNERGEEYGRKPLYAVLERHWQRPAAQILDAVFEDVDRFMAGRAPGDDQTAIVLKVA